MKEQNIKAWMVVDKTNGNSIHTTRSEARELKRAREEFGYKVKIAKLKFDRFAR